MKITTTDKSVKLQDGVLVWTGGLSAFTYTYSIPTDSVTFYQDNKLIVTGKLSDSTINGTQLTVDNIDTELDKVFKTATGGSVVESDPVFIEWKNGSSIVAGNGATMDDFRTGNVIIGEKTSVLTNNSVVIGYNSKVLANAGLAVGTNLSASSGVGIGNNFTVNNGVGIGRMSNSYTIQNGTAVGNDAYAQGQYSVAVGNTSYAYNPYEIGIGTYNKSVSTGTTADKTQFSVAAFDATKTVKKNVIEARQNDDIYIWKDGSQIKLQDNLGGVGRKVINVTDTKIRLDANNDLIYIWDFNDNVPFADFTMEEDPDSAALNTTNQATIILKYTGSQSSSMTITFPKNLVYSTDADATYYINATKGSGSEATNLSFKLAGNEMKVINIYGIGDKRVMEIDY